MKKEIVRLVFIYALGGVPALTHVPSITMTPVVQSSTLFDNPYRPTPFKNVLVTYANLWQLYELILQENIISYIITDALIGGSVRLEETVMRCIQQEQDQRSVHNDDIAYLIYLSEQLIQLHHQVSPYAQLHPNVLMNLSKATDTLKAHEAGDQHIP